ncbi:hypothetical protein HMPREF0501_00470 [Limosilactobacillus coleohominis 101-4-CHN]|uniref:Uncharacterized protein n=1 Tax=Limosilactobacillus coleohominis 101-4-CHN TaxID=575594 RepID=C7XUV4_9LACO|nr:hypothetical protein [Limosilactobacillus coleohominis]EEU31065.1 hypothetical protein HMPREF0501_00470 [Limosilactobacillus coleohominis 101-4-CHN]
MESKQKIPHIKIDGEIYDAINITKNNGELIASIGPKDVIEADGYKVTFVKH